MTDFVIPPPPRVCPECRKANPNRYNLFCSATCRIAHNERRRNLCAKDGCNNPVRTKHAVYCKSCYPKVHLKAPTKLMPLPPPGDYQCRWCDKQLKPHQVRFNALNENNDDHSIENFSVCCETHFHQKQKAFFFLKFLDEDRYQEFCKIINDARKR